MRMEQGGAAAAPVAEAPEIIGTAVIGVDTTPEQDQEAERAATREATRGKPKQKQPIKDGLAKTHPPQRNPDGTFAQEEHRNELSMKDAYNQVREMGEKIAKGALGDARDHQAVKAALDKPAPAPQVQSAKTDPAAKTPASPTATAKPEQTSTEATRQREQQLDKAHKALELDGWEEDDFADVPEERILALGKKAIEKHSQVKREQREAAEAAKKGATLDPAAQNGSPTKAKAPLPATEQVNEDAEYEKLAQEALGDGFEDEGGRFTKAIARFGRTSAERATGRLRAEHEARFAAHAAETETKLTDLGNQLAGEMRFEFGLGRVRSEFPQVDTNEGQTELREDLLALLSSKTYDGDFNKCVRRACMSRWGEDVRTKVSEKADKIRAAKGAGQPITSTQTAPPKELSIQEQVRQVVREKILNV